MITEDYVSFEIAELLKEKGFNEACLTLYREGKLVHPAYYLDNTQLDEDNITAPTLQMAMKWLREVHNIFFNVNYFHIDVGNKWACLTIWLPYKNGCEYSIEGFDIETIYEAAIKYCLENLI